MVHFVNGQFQAGGQTPDAAKYHYYFARQVLGISESLGEFNAVTYFTEDKRYVAGLVHTYQLDGGADPVVGIQFYPQDVIAEQVVVDAVTAVRAQLHLEPARFAFVPTGRSRPRRRSARSWRRPGCRW